MNDEISETDVDWCFWCEGSGEGYAPDTLCQACSSVAEKEYEPED
jgi:hypothetical protein